MNARKSYVLIVALVFAMLLVACGGPAAAPTPIPPMATSIPPAAPTPVPPTATAVPPTATPITPTAIPTTGTAMGSLVQTKTQRPLPGYKMKLLQTAPINGEAQVAIPGYGTTEEKPVATSITDNAGQFVFESIEPGTYALISEIVRPMGRFDGNIVSLDGSVIADVALGTTSDGVFAGLVEKTRVMLVEIGAGQVVDLGKVAIDDTSS